MGLVSQAKREAKRLLKDFDELIALSSNKYSHENFEQIKNFFYKIKGYKSYENFLNITQIDKKIKEQKPLMITSNIHIDFNKDIFMNNDEINIFPSSSKKIKNLTSSVLIHPYKDINYYNNLLLLDDKSDNVTYYASQDHTLLITDNFKLASVNSRVLSLNKKDLSIDPLNPLIGDIFSIKYFFGGKIYLWVNEILCFIKSNNCNIDIKNLDKLFFLPQLINYYTEHSDKFIHLKDYLNVLFNETNVSIDNISSFILENHLKYCYEGLVFSKTLKDYNCFQNNPSCDFYTENQSLSILINENNDFNKIASHILIYNIFQCSYLINYSYSGIIFRASLSFLSELESYTFKKTIFAPYTEEFSNENYKTLINSLFLNSHTYLIKLDINLETSHLPIYYIDKVCDISDFPVEYRKCHNFSDLKINKLLFINTSNKKYDILDSFN